MRFNSLGSAVYGATTVKIDGVAVPSLVGSTGGGWGWLDDTTIAGQSDPGGGFTLNQVIVSTDTLSTIDSHGANLSACGNGVVAAFLTLGANKGVRFPLSGFGPFSLAALGDVSPEGLSVIVQNYLSATTGLMTFSAAGSELSNKSVTLAGGYLIRAKDGVYAYQDAAGTHLRSLSTGTLQAFAPRTGVSIAQTVPITIAGAQWVVEASNTPTLTLRPATSSNGFVLDTGTTFNVDAVEVSSGVVWVGWCTSAGEGLTELRIAVVTVGTGGLTTGTTSGGGAPVFTPQTPITPSAVPVGPVEGGSLSALKQPRQAIKAEAFIGEDGGKRIYQKYWDDVAAQAFASPNLGQSTGTVDPSQGGTGTTTGLTVLDGGNLLPGTVPLDALVDETPSTLIGRGSAAGAGPPQEITLGEGLEMAGTVLRAHLAGGGSVPGADGDDGLNGPPGPPGADGATGAAGAAGPSGTPGLDGEDGLDGSPGPQGLPGAQGPPGVGVPGVDGDDGFSGLPGPAGADGAAGTAGAAGPIGIGIPGLDGDDGLDGVPGPLGATGAAGAAGSTGADGQPGKPGLDGDDGDIGMPGPPGLQGLTGVDGVDGTQPEEMFALIGRCLKRIWFLEEAHGGTYPVKDLNGPTEAELIALEDIDLLEDVVNVTYNQRLRTIGVTFDAGASVLTVGTKRYIQVPYAGTLLSWTVFAQDGNTGSIVIDVWRDAYENFPPTVADSIAGVSKPTITAATNAQSTSLVTWNAAFPAGSFFAFNIDSVSTFTCVTLELPVLVS